jgi:MFS family permease
MPAPIPSRSCTPTIQYGLIGTDIIEQAAHDERHFANGAMLPLAGQYMAQASPNSASIYMSACIIAAQLVMIPVAKFAGDRADSWGRRPIFLIGFGAASQRC